MVADVKNAAIFLYKIRIENVAILLIIKVVFFAFERMNFMKKIICLLLAFALVFTLCACGKEGSSDETSDKSTETISANDTVNTCKVGDYITFGSYEQNNETSDGAEEIEWLVLDVKEGKALLISKYALDCKPYNTEFVDITWENCTLRQWLNEEFINSAFSEDELKKILTTTVVAEDNEEARSEAGNDTQDKMFLLSISEVEKYFGSDEARASAATEFAVNQGSVVGGADGPEAYRGNCSWWLRSPGYGQGYGTIVDGGGHVYFYDNYVNYDNRSVRPAMWIELG